MLAKEDKDSINMQKKVKIRIYMLKKIKIT